jgi:hypothetical protein
MGNHSSYDPCTYLEVPRPSQWADESITFEVNHGSCSSGAAVLLFAVRQDGRVSDGLPVTLP